MVKITIILNNSAMIKGLSESQKISSIMYSVEVSAGNTELILEQKLPSSITCP